MHPVVRTAAVVVAAAGLLAAADPIPSATLKPGTYAFHCEYHPSRMRGTITVT